MEKSYRYLGHFLLLLIPLIFAGFYKSYFQPFPNFGEHFKFYLHIHAVLATLWVAILITQPFLIVNKKVKIHRAVGKASYIIFPLLIWSFIPQVLKRYNEGDYAFLFFPLADGILLILFYALAIYYKKKTARHMRYMICSALVFLGPTVGRMGPSLFGWSELFTQNFQYAITYAILVSLIVSDRNNKKNFTPYLVALVGYLVHQVVYHIVFL